eukprot:403348400
MSDICTQCNNFFNVTNRKPIFLDDYGCIWCLECINFHLIDNPKREIYCPIDKEFVTVPEKLRENRRMIDKLQSLNQHTVFCDEHEGQITNQYCTRCQIPICSHSEHSLLDLKPSSFKIYIDNVVKLLDEYSIENVKTQLIRLSNNESQLNSQDFKEIISKINRMLGKVLIDSTQSLEDPLYAPQNRNFQRSNVIEELGSQNNSNPQNIQQMINDSQSQLREEFRQQLRALEINQNQLNNEINGSIQLNIPQKKLAQSIIRLDLIITNRLLRNSRRTLIRY